MLSPFSRFIVVNNSGSLLTFNANGRINLKITGVYITPATGKVAYAPLGDDDCGFIAASTLADGAEIFSDEIDNSANLYIAYLVQLEITHDEGTAADGTFDVYYEGGDATGELPSDASGYDDAETNRLNFIGSLVWHASGADDEVMRSDALLV
ncbi:MAG TPA: hypothetical protein VMY37_04265 [Thermoguttaceae bacterium]|nr:hypothetical protein [Thermoguttaceae bacterium]